MTQTEKQKINRFLMDEVMSGAVYQVILSSFLKPKPRAEVTYHELAAERIAINLLEEAWKELQKHRAEAEAEKPQLKQVGL